MLKRLTSLDEVDAIIREAAALGDEPKRVAMLLEYYYDAGISPDLDPFSAEYLSEIQLLHENISGFKNYSPAINELTPYMRDDRIDYIRNAPPFGTGSSATVGDFLISIGFIMRTLDLKPGQSVIEYGPGSGHLAVTLARDGFDVTAVDIEPIYLEVIAGQCKALGIPITTFCGEFGGIPDPDKRYDAVLFFEAFHHALRHNDLLFRLGEIVKEGGVIAMAGEPIIEAGSYWEPAIPFAWGPRCDLLSVSAMRNYGWMELGFRESYFFEAMRRSGWSVTKHECSLTARGNTYIARRATSAELSLAEIVAPDYNVAQSNIQAAGGSDGKTSLWRRFLNRVS